MPCLFIGHGSPMNAIEPNRFSDAWALMAADIPTPAAILCVSAHWETEGPRVTAMAQPRTIHDFHGFPAELHAMRYRAPGAPLLAERIAALIPEVSLDQQWGLDHGCWSVLGAMFPRADVPVLQLSLDRRRSPATHLSLARALAPLRREGVLVVGSGNLVHNLAEVVWADTAHPWAVAFDALLAERITAGPPEQLLDPWSLAPEGPRAVPSLEHYLPALYVLALRQPEEPLRFFCEAVTLGAIGMRSLQVG